MGCTKLVSHPPADQHFERRYLTHGVIKFIDFDKLKDEILEYYKKGKIAEDRKHAGYEGPRYHIHIPVGKNSEIKVVVEETPKCLLPITTWPKNL